MLQTTGLPSECHRASACFKPVQAAVTRASIPILRPTSAVTATQTESIDRAPRRRRRFWLSPLPEFFGTNVYADKKERNL